MKKTICLLLACLLLMSVVAGCSKGKNTDPSGNAGTPEKFPAFETRDLSGSPVTSDIFSKNAVTVINVWFIDCTACVREMPELEKIAQSYEGKGVAFYSVCTDLGGMADAEERAKKVLSDAGVTFPTLYPTGKDTAFGKFLGKIFAFPTTVLVNRSGEIVGKPIRGSIVGSASVNAFKERIDAMVAADIKA